MLLPGCSMKFNCKPTMDVLTDTTQTDFQPNGAVLGLSCDQYKE